MKHSTNTMTIFFFVAILLIFVEGFLFENGSIFFVLFPLFLVYIAWKRQKKKLFWISSIFSILFLLSMWSMRLIIFLFLIYTLYRLMKKEPIEVDLSFFKKTDRKANRLVTEEEDRTASYAWEDVHVQSFAGHLVIDTTKTILPQSLAIINVRQGFGKTTIIVPYEVPVHIHYNALYGELHPFQESPYRLMNESVSFEDAASTDTKQQLIIYVSTFIGDLEVIRK